MARNLLPVYPVGSSFYNVWVYALFGTKAETWHYPLHTGKDRKPPLFYEDYGRLIAILPWPGLDINMVITLNGQDFSYFLRKRKY